jgi:molybdate transport system regulatory protein
MNMAYRHAWLLVETMNRLARAPLVEKRVGGSGGGSAQLTAEGRKTMADFKKMQQAFRKFMSGQKVYFFKQRYI